MSPAHFQVPSHVNAETLSQCNQDSLHHGSPFRSQSSNRCSIRLVELFPISPLYQRPQLFYMPVDFKGQRRQILYEHAPLRLVVDLFSFSAFILESIPAF